MGEPIECAHTVEGKGPALFLIHGIGAARDAWRFLVPKLKNEFSCITYDLRGHGESPIPTNKFELDDLVDDLERLRQQLNIERGHFVGHSLGGMIGPAYARKYPDRVLSLGLLSTAAGRTEEDADKVQKVQQKVEQQGVDETLPTFIDRWFTQDFIDKNPEVIERRLQQVRDTNFEVFNNVFRIYAETEMAPWLYEITQPCLVLTGELDGGCNPRLNGFIADQLPNSKLVILDGYKHSILLEAGEQVAEHIQRFIENLEPIS